MDPTDEPVDDDLFADLYGDDEPPKSNPEPVKPTEASAPAAPSIPEPSKPVAKVTPEVAAPLQAALKAVDPRVPPPSAAPPQQYQPPPQPQQEQIHQVADSYGYNGQDEYQGWEAAGAGQDMMNMNDNKGYDPMGGINGYGDSQGTGSPAIKEDGCVFTLYSLARPVHCFLFFS